MCETSDNLNLHAMQHASKVYVKKYICRTLKLNYFVNDAYILYIPNWYSLKLKVSIMFCLSVFDLVLNRFQK